MKTVRRLYFYAVALISLEVVLWGLIGLLRTIVNNLVAGAGNALARALALIVVGVPIFLVHWLWAQNASARDQEEQTASLRGVFFYAALFGTLVPVVQNLLALINRLLLGAAAIPRERALLGGFQTWPDNLIAIAMNLLVAAYFWNTLRREWSTIPNAENFSEVRRLYRYLWLLYSLLMTIFGAQQLIRFIFFAQTNLAGVLGGATFVNGLALVLVGTPVWLYTWRVCQEALSNPTEKESMLRLGVLYLLALGGVIAVLAAGGNLLFHVLDRLLGAGTTWADFLERIGGSISVGVPLAAVWAYYGGWLARHIDAVAEGPQREALRRPYQYILSLIGLVASFVGATLLLRVIIDLGVSRDFVGNQFLREREAAALATMLVGLPLWIAAWLPAERQARDEGVSGLHARRSLVRRAYLYLVLFASVIGGMVAAVTLVFQLLSTLLTGESTGNFLVSVLNSLQLLVLFVVVLLYHLAALRRDGASRAEAPALSLEQYPVLVIDPGHGDFAEKARLALNKQSARLLVAVMAASGHVPEDAEYQAVILPASVALNPPDGLKGWLHGFTGRRIIIPDEAEGALLAADARQASLMARQLADGQEVRALARGGSSAWMIVIYIFAALFAAQLLAGLLVIGISSLVD
jgi:hypothetical protein